MTAIVVSDPTEEGFNSFVSIEQADAYFDGTYFGDGEAWEELDSDTKARLLITASRAMSMLNWAGTAVSALAFPRTYGFSSTGVMPDFLVALTCEWAKWIWQDTTRAAEQNDGIISEVKVGPLAVKYAATPRAGVSSLPPVILSLLQPLSPTYLNIGNKARSLSMRY